MLTPEQQAAQQKFKDAAAARAKAKADLKAKRDALRANIGQTFTNGEQDATVTAFEDNHYADGVRGEAYLVNLGNPNAHFFRNCDIFLSEFQPKGAQ